MADEQQRADSHESDSSGAIVGSGAREVSAW
jgi:hypothetical protein